MSSNGSHTADGVLWYVPFSILLRNSTKLRLLHSLLCYVILSTLSSDIIGGPALGQSLLPAFEVHLANVISATSRNTTSYLSIARHTRESSKSCIFKALVSLCTTTKTMYEIPFPFLLV
jgi:hypothetical protein